MYVGVAATGALSIFMLQQSPTTSEEKQETIALQEALSLTTQESTHIIPSPNEQRLTITYIIQTYITEPISTFFRFLHLALLFGPVILTSPMLLVGSTKASRRLLQRGAIGQGEDVERWGAVWWYGFLVAQMERAGPTFIKVSLLISLQLRTQPRERHAEDALSNIS
jgi:aarF domain-containing kinase